MKLLVGGTYRRIGKVEKWLKEKGCDLASQMEIEMEGGFFWYTYRFDNEFFQMIYKPTYPFYLYIFKPATNEVFSPHVFYYYLQTGTVVNVHEDFETNIKLSELSYGEYIEL